MNVYADIRIQTLSINRLINLMGEAGSVDDVLKVYENLEFEMSRFKNLHLNRILLESVNKGSKK